MRVLLDTNIVLDLLLQREPFIDDARDIFLLIENNQIDGFLSATTITTLHYIISKSKDKEEANHIIKTLLKLFNIAPIDKVTLLKACDDNGIDYEDSVIYSSAKISKIDIIITRDSRGFKNSKVKVLKPKEFLAIFDI